MKRLLIISPHFPPVNAADMHRIRQSLPFFAEYGWESEVIAVDPRFVEGCNLEPLLERTIPNTVKVHWVKAWKAEMTRKFGLGSVSMRSFFHIRKKGNQLLHGKHFDLVYFSTTAFHVMALGPYWKKKFGVPFVLDIQDPWRNDFYLTRPKKERPPKFFLAYNINKYLEKYTVPKADGIIAVSIKYIETFLSRYSSLDSSKCRVIPFGGNVDDFELAETITSSSIHLSHEKLNFLYIGRGGHDLQLAIRILFEGFKKGLKEAPEIFKKVHFWFLGTDYAPSGQGTNTIAPLALATGVEDYVTEVTDRIPYFETLNLLKKADALCIPGSTDKGYTASKIYPYILAKKPLLCIFYKESSTVDVVKETKAGTVISFDTNDDPNRHINTCLTALSKLISTKTVETDLEAFEPHTAKARTKSQTEFFQLIISPL